MREHDIQLQEYKAAFGTTFREETPTARML
jgi:hypothetical protein